MPPADDLPPPSPEAAATAARLVARIEAALDAAGGWMPFSRFMAMALHEPGLGYYSAGAVKIGRDPADGSDFATAPEMTPLFARALARCVADGLEPDQEVVELGAGTGALAAELLPALDALGRAPRRYAILETSADLRDRQRARLMANAPALAARVAWLDALPAAIDGVVVGNELLDALPVDRIVRRRGGWLESGVVRGPDGLAFHDRPAPAALAESIAMAIPDVSMLADGYVTERHRQSDALVAALVASLGPRSTLLLIDYGFPASEYFHPQRSGGTLMAHYRHRATPDVLARPGLQDVTSHVDFTAVARSAARAGGIVAGYASQASFLIDCGILDAATTGADAPVQWARDAAALQQLLSEAEMGELFKVICIAPTVRERVGFRRSDRRAALTRHPFG